MKLTKYQHACLVIEESAEVLVVDPGNLSDDFSSSTDITAVIITHEHPDHIDPAKIDEIIDQNPDVTIISHAGIIGANAWPHTRMVAPGDSVVIGPFKLEFFGGKHAVIHQSLPVVDNIGVLINDDLYYPGDSYALPEKPVKYLAAPTSGPWLKIGDVADFINDVKPEQVFSTHDVHSSKKNEDLIDFLLPKLIGPSGAHYERLKNPIEIS